MLHEVLQHSHHGNSRRRGDEPGIENLFEEITTENFSNLVKEKYAQVQEAQRAPNKMDPKRPTLRHIIIKMAKHKDKERILKTAREEQLVIYEKAPISLSSNFSIGTFQARRT